MKSRGARKLQFQDLVIVAIGLDGVVQLLQEFAAVTGQKVDTANTTLLQAFVRIERLAQHFSMAV